MSCRCFEKLLALHVEGDLPSGKIGVVENHLLGCADCRALMEELRESQSALKSLREESPEAGMLAAVRSGVLARISATPEPRGFARLWWRYAAVACTAASLLLVFHPRSGRPLPGGRGSEMAPYRAATVRERSETPRPVVSSNAPRRHKTRRALAAHKVTAQPVKKEHSEPLVVKMYTDDPNIVIIWLVDKEDTGD